MSERAWRTSVASYEVVSGGHQENRRDRQARCSQDALSSYQVRAATNKTNVIL